MAHNDYVGEGLSAMVSMEVKNVLPDALRKIGLAVKIMVGKAEARLTAVNKICETWPMVDPQLEALDKV